MQDNPAMPHRLPDLSDSMRLFLAGVRDDEVENLRLLAGLREEERESLRFVIETFSKDDLLVISESLENLRTMKRFGRFGLWLSGFVVAGAAAAAAVKGFFVLGGPK